MRCLPVEARLQRAGRRVGVLWGLLGDGARRGVRLPEGRLRRAAPGVRGVGDRFTGRDLFEVGDDHLTFFEGDELCLPCAVKHGVL